MINDLTLTTPDATLVVELAAFLLVLLIVGKFLLPRLRATVEQRQASITESFAAADAAERRLAAAEADAQRTLAEARRQARTITDGARVTKDELIAEGRREGQAEYRWRASRAERERQRDEKIMRRRLAIETTQVLVEAIREVSEDEVESARLTELVAKAMMSTGGVHQDAWRQVSVASIGEARR
jgi:F-type H+-transporting ATPase subunit b